MSSDRYASARVVEEYYWCLTCGLRAKFHETGTASSGPEREGCSEKSHEIVVRTLIEFEEE